MPILTEPSPTRQARHWWLLPLLAVLPMLAGLFAWSFYSPLSVALGTHQLTFGRAIRVPPGTSYLVFTSQGIEKGKIPAHINVILIYKEAHYIFFWR